MAGRKNKKKKGSVLLWIIFAVALAVFLYAGYRLFGIMRGYHKSTEEYKTIEAEYTTPRTPSGEASAEGSGDGAEEKEQPSGETDAEPPIDIDWESLKEINGDIVGWIWFDAFSDTISYPVLRGTDNDYYLHHTFEKQYVYAGSIFENWENSADFADPHTIVYGHNMLNGSMFSKLLKLLDEPDLVEKDPYFWILTPQGNYRYLIFSVFEGDIYDDVYTLFSGHGIEFAEWAKAQQAKAAAGAETEITEDDFIVTLSTCKTANGPGRILVLGKCVSAEKPKEDAAAREADAALRKGEG